MGSCSLCWYELTDPNFSEPIVLKKCGHLFHKNCVKPWVQGHGECPKCRTEQTIRSIRRIYPESLEDDDILTPQQQQVGAVQQQQQAHGCEAVMEQVPVQKGETNDGKEGF